MFEEDSVLGDEEAEVEVGRMKLLLELEALVCRARQLVGTLMQTGGTVLLTALLGLTGSVWIQEDPGGSQQTPAGFSPLLSPQVSSCPLSPPSSTCSASR